MLSQIQKNQQNKDMKHLIMDFIDKIQPQLSSANHGKPSIQDGSTDTIPLRMRDAYPYPIPMDMYKGGPAIPLKSIDELMKDVTSDSYVHIEEVKQ